MSLVSNESDHGKVRQTSEELTLATNLVAAAAYASKQSLAVAPLVDGISVAFQSVHSDDMARRVAEAITPPLIALRDEKFRQLSEAMGVALSPQKSKPQSSTSRCGYGHAGEDRAEVIVAAIAARRSDPDLPSADHKQSDGEILSIICADYMARRSFPAAANVASV